MKKAHYTALRLTPHQHQRLTDAVKLGAFPSRSEAIRAFITDGVETLDNILKQSVNTKETVLNK